jgi:ABC-type nitrate/sulfonate/bicarbonate transport system substrate-binding protein
MHAAMLITLWMFGAVLCSSAGLASLYAQEKAVPVNVSIGSLAVGLAPYVIAKENGYFRQEGIQP